MFTNFRYISCGIFQRVLISILTLAVISSTAVLPAFAAGSQQGTTNKKSSVNADNSVGTGNNLISINMADVDVRDVLSAIAIDMGVNIIYLDNPARISFKAEGITAGKALDLLVETLGNGESYLRNGNLIIVGSSDRLKKDFFNEMALTRFRVSYITPDELSKQLDALGVPVQKITMDQSSNFLWTQGTPMALAKAASVIAALDKQENFDKAPDGTIKSNINLKAINLNYITADRLDELIHQLDIKAQTIKLDTNPQVIWMNGSQQAMADINQLVVKVDIPESAGEIFDMTAYKLKSLTYDKLIKVVGQLKLPVDIITVGASQKALWLKGAQKDIDDLETVIQELDTTDNSEESQFFFYTLNNISPEDAAARLSFLDVSGVTSLTLDFPQLSHEILIKCPSDMIATVTRILGNIDVSGQKIRVPVDSGPNSYQLFRRRDLLCRLLGLAASSMTVSDNVSKDGGTTPYYVLWVEDTPDNITKIKEMIKLIDNPTGGT